jgi:hypothetical protein
LKKKNALRPFNGQPIYKVAFISIDGEKITGGGRRSRKHAKEETLELSLFKISGPEQDGVSA